MTKEQLAEVARMLALHVADYQSRFGEIPRSDLLQLLGVTEINEDQAKLLRDGMQTLTGYLACYGRPKLDPPKPIVPIQN